MHMHARPMAPMRKEWNMATPHERALSRGDEDSMSQMPTDPVCGMTVDPEHASGSYDYNGETYYFCSQSCLKRFAAAPEQYTHAQSAAASPQRPSTPATSGTAD